MDVADKFISEKCCLPLLLYIVFAVSVCLSILRQPSFVYCRAAMFAGVNVQIAEFHYICVLYFAIVVMLQHNAPACSMLI